jgi:8-oxo-dGTP pyrophosphatase MutT (NUDIX family)
VPVPEFILDLRRHVGHALLWLPGVTAVVSGPDGRVLVTRRSDDGRWALPSGIPEPGEDMAAACAREVLEETGVHVAVERLVSVVTLPPMAYPNGDRCQFLDLTFRCRAVGGTAHVADDESLDVEWRAVEDLAQLSDEQRRAVERALGPDEGPWFQR